MPLDKLVYGLSTEIPAKRYAPALEAIGWKPDDPGQRVLLALALGKVSNAAEEGAVAFESLSTLLNDGSTDIRERTALSLSSRRLHLSPTMSAQVEAIVNARNDRLAQELRQRIERLKNDELMCLSCGNVQPKGEWEKRMDDQSKAAGYTGFVNINSKARCSKCNSDDMAGPRWDGYLFEADRIAYYKKLRELGVQASWIR